MGKYLCDAVFMGNAETMGQNEINMTPKLMCQCQTTALKKKKKNSPSVAAFAFWILPSLF